MHETQILLKSHGTKSTTNAIVLIHIVVELYVYIFLWHCHFGRTAIYRYYIIHDFIYGYVWHLIGLRVFSLFSEMLLCDYIVRCMWKWVWVYEEGSLVKMDEEKCAKRNQYIYLAHIHQILESMNERVHLTKVIRDIIFWINRMKEVLQTLIALANCFVHFQLSASIIKVHTAPVRTRVIILLMIRIRLRFAQ